ncbi:hypothetical protein Tco_1164296 [Tanacetum coccineum]
MSIKERLVADTKKSIKASILVIGPQQTTSLSKGVGLIPEVLDEPKVDSAATDVSEESWSFVVLTDKVGFQSERLAQIYYDDEEEDDNDDDKSIDIEEIDDDERTESDNKDQAMDDAEKNDEDKVEEEKDTDHQPALNEQAKDDQVGVLASKTHKEKPTLFVSTSSHSVSSNYGNQFLISSPECSLLAPLLDVLAFVVPPTPITLTPPIIPTTKITTIEAPASTSVNPESETLSALQLRVSDLEKEVKELKHADLSTTLRALIRSEVPSAVNEYLGSSLGYALQKEPKVH